MRLSVDCGRKDGKTKTVRAKGYNGCCVKDNKIQVPEENSHKPQSAMMICCSPRFKFSFLHPLKEPL